MKNSTRPNKPELDATKVPTEIDIAWAAGIYEGEGTCRLCGYNKRSFMATVVQKDPELLYRLRDWFGGSLQGNSNLSGAYAWNICGDRARIFVALIYKFMTARRRAQIDATNCLDFLGSESPNGMNMTQLKDVMDKFYSDHREMVRLRTKKAKQEQYKRYASDPQWVERDRQKKADARARKTPAELEISRKERNARLFRNKKTKELKSSEVYIDKTSPSG